MQCINSYLERADARRRKRRESPFFMYFLPPTDSLFRAVSFSRYGTDTRHERVKEQCIQFLRLAAEEFAVELLEVEVFIRKEDLLSKLETWERDPNGVVNFADDTDLYVVAQVYNLTVVVHQDERGTEPTATRYDPLHDEPKDEIHLVRSPRDGHFDLLIPKEQGLGGLFNVAQSVAYETLVKVVLDAEGWSDLEACDVINVCNDLVRKAQHISQFSDPNVKRTAIDHVDRNAKLPLKVAQGVSPIVFRSVECDNFRLLRAMQRPGMPDENGLSVGQYARFDMKDIVDCKGGEEQEVVPFDEGRVVNGIIQYLPAAHVRHTENCEVILMKNHRRVQVPYHALSPLPPNEFPPELFDAVQDSTTQNHTGAASGSQNAVDAGGDRPANEEQQASNKQKSNYQQTFRSQGRRNMSGNRGGFNHNFGYNNGVYLDNGNQNTHPWAYNGVRPGGVCPMNVANAGGAAWPQEEAFGSRHEPVLMQQQPTQRSNDPWAMTDMYAQIQNVNFEDNSTNNGNLPQNNQPKQFIPDFSNQREVPMWRPNPPPYVPPPPSSTPMATSSSGGGGAGAYYIPAHELQNVRPQQQQQMQQNGGIDSTEFPPLNAPARVTQAEDNGDENGNEGEVQSNVWNKWRPSMPSTDNNDRPAAASPQLVVASDAQSRQQQPQQQQMQPQPQLQHQILTQQQQLANQAEQLQQHLAQQEQQFQPKRLTAGHDRGEVGGQQVARVGPTGVGGMNGHLSQQTQGNLANMHAIGAMYSPPSHFLFPDARPAYQPTPGPQNPFNMMLPTLPTQNANDQRLSMTNHGGPIPTFFFNNAPELNSLFQPQQQLTTETATTPSNLASLASIGHPGFHHQQQNPMAQGPAMVAPFPMAPLGTFFNPHQIPHQQQQFVYPTFGHPFPQYLPGAGIRH